jgi:hypothetical protein
MGDRHTFTVSVRLRGAHSDYHSDLVPQVIEAYNLVDALRLASERPFHYWFEENNKMVTEGLVTEHDMLEEAQAKLVRIKVALGRVDVYKDLVDHSPTEMMVDDLVRDHEELEARIDAVLHYVSSHEDGFDTEQYNEVARLLKGGKRVPDSPEDLEGLDNA